MRAWQAVVLLNLALLTGTGWGYAWWGRRAAALEQREAALMRDVVAERARSEQLERELATARAGSGVTAPAAQPWPAAQRWQVRGVVRAILPDINLIIMTHEAIPGFMAPMTMGFRGASPRIHEGIHVGDTVRFTLEGAPPNVVITAIEKTG